MAVRVRFVFASLACSAAFAAAAACGSAELTSGSSVPNQDGSADGHEPTSDGGSFASDSGVGAITANGIVLVHAASFGAFRLCFESTPSAQPMPSAELMPDSNIVGVDVGSAVRIDPMGTPGKVWAFAVDDIKSLYPPGKPGPSCDVLRKSSLSRAIEVATITDDLSTGVHLLVLEGSASGGDLRLETIALPAYGRGATTTLPVQIVPLSRDLATRAGDGGSLGVAFGDLDAAPPAPFVEGALPFGKPSPTHPYPLGYQPDDEAAYATTGFFVSLGTASVLDAGLRDVVLLQSLADVQRLSAPRAIPSEWYAAGSSYVLLLLGSTGDAGADQRSQLHFLAVPVVAPDAGAPADAAAD